MTTTINGRTPEEIKKGLEYYAETDLAKKLNACKQGLKYWYAEDVAADALALIQQLEYELSEIREYYDCSDAANTELHSALYAMKRERDAAVEQLKEVDRVDLFCCSHCIHDELCNDGLTSCIDCDKDCPCHTCEKGSNWQWRGVQEVE